MSEPDPGVEVRTSAGCPIGRAAVFGTALAVARVAATIAGERDHARVVWRIVDGCVETLGASSAYLLTHEGRGVLRLAAHRNVEPEAIEQLERVTTEDPLPCAEAARTRELQVHVDRCGDRGGEVALFAAPLVANGRLHGVVGLTRMAGPATPEERETVAAIASLFAFGVANARSSIRESVVPGRTPESFKSKSMVGAGGHHRRAIGTREDIAGRARAEEERGRLLALVAERSWLRTVIDRSPIGILIYESADGTRLAANRRVEEMFGGPVPLPVRGQLLRPDRTPIELEDFPSRRALDGESVDSEEFLLVRNDGSEMPILASAAPIRDGEGAVLGAVVDLLDITPLKEQARMREEWTSVVAHDLRQPVTTISAYGALLARHSDPSVRARAGHVLAANKRLDRMIADLLDVSRLEVHRLALDLRTVVLPPLLREVSERTIVETGADRIHVLAPEDLPAVRADPSRLDQALTNILVNAVKYGYADAPIRVSAWSTDGFVEIAVENRGPGILPADIPKLFQRFQRGGRVSRVAGIGLGLYITRGIVEAHGGCIHAESVPGETTTFRFTIPVADGADPASQ